MNWIVLLIYLYISYYTFSYSRTVWKGGQKFASVCIMIMAVSLIALPVVVLFVIS